MKFKGSVYLLIILLFSFSSLSFALIKNSSLLEDYNSPDTNLEKQSIIKLNDMVAFDTVGDQHDLWKLNGYIFKCDNNTGYECELFLGKKKLKEVDLTREYDVVDFLLYIFQAKIKNYPYKVILIEAQAERGTAWYYTVVLKDNVVTDSFFIDQGRRYFSSTKEYLAQHPEADEMYINPKEFISIYIDNNEQVIIRLNKKYLYPSDVTVEVEDKNFIYITRKLSKNSEE